MNDLQDAIETDAGHNQQAAYAVNRWSDAPHEEGLVLRNQRCAQDTRSGGCGECGCRTSDVFELSEGNVDADPWPELFDHARRAPGVECHSPTIAHTMAATIG